MTTLPLDVESLLGELEDPANTSFEALPDGTTMGHVHLKVASIPETIHFYRDILGFELMAELGPYAAFLSAGGYHHHLGANTWESAGAGPPPAGRAALQQATVVLPDEEERDRVLHRVRRASLKVEEAFSAPLIRDPSGNQLRLVTAVG
jgi:catechol 2,3-dioxygenase